MKNKVNNFFEDIKYFRDNGVGFREVLQIVCYKTDQENPANKWLKKLDSQVNKKGVLVLDVQDMFILNGLADEIGDKLVGKIIGSKIELPNLTPNLNTYSKLNKKYIDAVVYILSTDIMLMIDTEILRDKF